MIHELYCPVCDRTFFFCMDKYPKGNDKYHIDGTFCKHSLELVKKLIAGDNYE